MRSLPMGQAEMLNDTAAIRATQLSKRYQIYSSPRDMLVERITGRPRHTVFDALHPMDLTVAKGQVMGIMGPNGAGKSTLLKLISGTIRPTGGHVQVNGRVSAILELGTGFTAHNTGRENIRMGCLCLGMDVKEVDQKEEEIIAFSELSEFIDRPFGTYSSGMQARLTFAVAISPEPDVLIVDEALAVGDARFQQKCFGRIRAMREAGTSILIVSHDDNTISSFCDDAIILQAGRKTDEGAASDMAIKYHRLLFGEPSPPSSDDQAQGQQGSNSSDATADPSVDGHVDPAVHPTDDPPLHSEVEEVADHPPEDTAPNNGLATGHVYGNGAARLVDCAIRNSDGVRVESLLSGQRYSITFEAEANRELEACSFGFAIRDRRASTVWGMTNRSCNREAINIQPGERLHASVDVGMWLAEGEYALVVGVASDETGEKFVHADPALYFAVKGPFGAFTTATVNLDAAFEHHVKTVDTMEA